MKMYVRILCLFAPGNAKNSLQNMEEMDMARDMMSA